MEDGKGRAVAGLDCSGFVGWVYWTAFGVKPGMSTGTFTDSLGLEQIGFGELQPGNIGLQAVPGAASNHIGIFLGLDENGNYYEADKVLDDSRKMADYILNNLHGLTFPGWEPERMARLDELFEAYKPVTKEKLWENLKYFLEKLMPVCHECDIKMAIHMDDPPWDIFGLPRLLVDAESIDKFLAMVDDPYNCLTLCSGSLNANPKNNVAEIIYKHCDRIAFAHIRNVKHFPNGDFSEASHRDCDGDTGILEIVKAYHDCGFQGYIRPDHGRHLWNEGPGNVRPGYGLYDRALGIMYMLGIWDMLDKLEETEQIAVSGNFE